MTSEAAALIRTVSSIVPSGARRGRGMLAPNFSEAGHLK